MDNKTNSVSSRALHALKQKVAAGTQASELLDELKQLTANTPLAHLTSSLAIGDDLTFIEALINALISLQLNAAGSATSGNGNLSVNLSLGGDTQGQASSSRSSAEAVQLQAQLQAQLGSPGAVSQTIVWLK